MLRLNELRVPLDYTPDTVRELIIRRLRLRPDCLLSWSLLRRSVDARDRSDVHFVLSLLLDVANEKEALACNRFLSVWQPPSVPPLPNCRFQYPPVVVGAGPSGLFAALTFARAGVRPVLIERGKPVDERVRDIAALEERGILDPESNIQFGEGGAGTFSDGKLTTGIQSPYIREVLETFVKHGAPEEILWEQWPHIGTDRLRGVISSMRREIEELGGRVLFGTKLTELIISNGCLIGLHAIDQLTKHRTAAGDAESPPRTKFLEFRTDTLLLAIGHSARDTLQSLYAQGVAMQQKPFAIGARIEHPQAFINRARYGRFSGHPALGAANYKLCTRTPDGRGVYTFCMCPGGRVIAATSEPHGAAVNGMSEYLRNGANANSAVLTGVRTDDFGSGHPLAGIELQRRIERAAYELGGGNYRAPAQRIEDFLADRASTAFGEVVPSYLPGAVPSDLSKVFPEYIINNLKLGLCAMNQQLHGFAMPDAVLTAPETRSSSPVRLPREDNGEASGVSGLYPVGEGAGYAGGIVSSAVDGIQAAHSAMKRSLEP